MYRYTKQCSIYVPRTTMCTCTWYSTVVVIYVKKSNTVVRMVHVLYCRVQYRVPVVELIYLYKYREKYPPVVYM